MIVIVCTALVALQINSVLPYTHTHTCGKIFYINFFMFDRLTKYNSSSQESKIYNMTNYTFKLLSFKSAILSCNPIHLIILLMFYASDCVCKHVFYFLLAYSLPPYHPVYVNSICKVFKSKNVFIETEPKEKKLHDNMSFDSTKSLGHRLRHSHSSRVLSDNLSSFYFPPPFSTLL